MRSFSGIIGLIQDSRGEIPAFILTDEASAELWAKAAIQLSLEKLKNRMTNPEDLPELFTEQFIQNAGLNQVYEWAECSRHFLVNLVLPNKFKPWQFGEIEQWMEKKETLNCAREALEWLMSEKLGCSRGDLPHMLSRQVFKNSGLELLLVEFDDSSFQLVDSVFPNVFKPWQFVEEEPLIWFHEDRFQTAQKATKWLIEERLGIPAEEIPKRVSIREFHMNGLSKLLDLFNQNLFLVVENAYPKRFKAWEFSEQTELWKSPDALETAKQATEWLITDRLQLEQNKAAVQLTRRHFLNNGLGFMLGSMFNHSHFLALENTFNDLKSNEIFQKALFTYSQELRDISTN